MITNMKAITTIFFILVLGITAQAQDVKKTLEKEIVTEVSFNEVTVEKENTIARLYKSKNHRIIKALSFTTKKNKSKLV